MLLFFGGFGNLSVLENRKVPEIYALAFFQK